MQDNQNISSADRARILRDRDLEVIDMLMKGRSLDREDDVRAIYSVLQSGNYHFTSKEGMAFDNQVYERMQRIKRGGKVTGKSIPKQTSPEARDVAGSSDNELDRAARELLRKQDNRRKRLTVLAFILAGVFLTVFVVMYAIDKSNDTANEELIALKETEPINRDLPEFTKVIKVNEDEEPVIFEVLDQYKNLYNLNKSLIGWLKIDDTIIDYPVLQTVDNTYYLTHNFDGEEDKKGSLFLDYRCSITSFNTNMIIYGHHLRSGKMFGTLPDYEDEAFFEEHRFVQFDTIYEERTYQVMYVFRSQIYTEGDLNFKYYNFLKADSAAEFDSYMKEMASMSLYDTGVTASFGDELLTLSTCDNLTAGERFVVVCKRVR